MYSEKLYLNFQYKYSWRRNGSWTLLSNENNDALSLNDQRRSVNVKCGYVWGSSVFISVCNVHLPALEEERRRKEAGLQAERLCEGSEIC